jgi:hypothetical protein
MIAGIAIFIFIYAVILFLGNMGERVERYSNLKFTQSTSNHPVIDKTDIVYNGSSNSIGLGEIESVLEKSYPYYASLK